MKVSVPKGTRDFSPIEMVKRNFIFKTIREVFEKYGYQPIETPAMENTETLMGKYGDEGDKLIFKIIESGEFTSELNENLWKRFQDIIVEEEQKNIIIKLSESVARQITNILDQKEKLSKEYLLTHLSIDKFFLDLNMDPIYWYGIKNAFVGYIFARTSYFKTRPSETTEHDIRRIKYYRQIKNRIDRENQIKDDLKVCAIGSKKIKEIIRYETILRKNINPTSLSQLISKKALRYDLTVPFARYVVQHQNEITFPFKRYQIQPVWRADKPQKGRYREFYQCDADVIGSDSLMNEVEIVQIMVDVFLKLKVPFEIKFNNRKILTGMAEVFAVKDKFMDLIIAIDKYEKIGDKIYDELKEKKFSLAIIEKVKSFITQASLKDKGDRYVVFQEFFSGNETALKGFEEVKQMSEMMAVALQGYDVAILNNINHSLLLARGLNYYTGTIFEVKANDVQIGSICGGGRYDDLTGIFGLPNVSGVGISFGIDRIFDVMNELNLFDSIGLTASTTKVLLAHFGEEERKYCIGVASQLRFAGINTEIYPDVTKKIAKQFDYANKKQIPFVIVVGGDEVESGDLALKNMSSGEQEKLKIDTIISKLK
ncbi:MAG: histidine--tRNA ligase [Bacteroidetes bacterium]|nr:histidine--tRNA ligase [Bacteroidota bacterium]